MGFVFVQQYCRLTCVRYSHRYHKNSYCGVVGGYMHNFISGRLLGDAVACGGGERFASFARFLVSCAGVRKTMCVATTGISSSEAAAAEAHLLDSIHAATESGESEDSQTLTLPPLNTDISRLRTFEILVGIGLADTEELQTRQLAIRTVSIGDSIV